MKYFILFIFLSSINQFAQAQSEQEIQKMMKKAQSTIDKNKDKDDDQYLTGFEDVDEEELLLKLPPKKTALLAAIPKKILSKTELTAYITNLKIQLLQKIDANKVQAAKAAINTLGSQADKLHGEAISAWYNGLQQEAALLLLEAAQKKSDDGLLLNNLAALLNIGGAPQKAIPILKNLLLTYPENAMVLNNLGQSYANLGEADTAMHYIERCLKIVPMHASANYTAGVIEATKGNFTKADMHLTNAVIASPNPQSIGALKKLRTQIGEAKEGTTSNLLDDTPNNKKDALQLNNPAVYLNFGHGPLYTHANYVAGEEEVDQNYITKAETQLSKAVYASTSQSKDALKKLNSRKPLSQLLKPKFKMPGDFNPLKYEFPKQLEDASQGKIIQKQHEEFWNYLNELISLYSGMMDEEGEKGEKILRQKIAAVQKDPFSQSASSMALVRPFTVTANLVILNLIEDLGAQELDVFKYKEILEKQIAEKKEKYDKEMELLAVEYRERYDKLPMCGEAHCFDAVDELDNEFCEKRTKATNNALKEMAAYRRNIQEKQRIAALNKFELMGYWGYFAGANEAFARQGYYNAILEYLKTIQKAAVTEYLTYPCDILPDVEATKQINKEEVAKTFCPFNITVAVVVVKLKFDCDKFSIQGGEGIRFKYEKEFSSSASSISLGVGLGFDVGIGTSVSTGFSAEATEAVYIGFDKENNITDAGLEVTARSSLESKVETIKMTERLELKAGYKIGVNSGINFTGNAFKLLK